MRGSGLKKPKIFLLKSSKRENKQVGLCKKLLHIKGNHQQNKKANLWKKFANPMSDKGLLSKDNEELIRKKGMHPHVHCSIIYNSQDMEAT